MAKAKGKKAKQRAGEKRARRARKKRKPAPVTSGKPPPRAPNRFGHNYKTPSDLQLIGPLVWAEWSVPPSLEKALVASGKPVPAPVTGRMLVDTGATATCISEEAAAELQLRQVDIRTTTGVHGPQETPIYQAKFDLSIADAATGVSSTISREGPVAAVKSLEEMFAKMGVKTGGKDGGRLIGLLGRDFLRHTTFTYYGCEGRIELAVDLPGLSSA